MLLATLFLGGLAAIGPPPVSVAETFQSPPVRVDDAPLQELWDESEPALVARPLSLHVVYTRGPNGDRDIWSARSMDEGASWATYVRVSDGPVNTIQEHPDLAQVPSYLFAVWQDRRSGSFQIFFSRSSTGGASWNPSFRLDDSSGEAMEPTIAAEGTQVMVAWEDTRSGAREIWSTNSSDSGATWSVPQRVDEPSAGGGKYHPALGAFGNRFWAVWQNTSSDGGDITGASWSAGAWGPESRVDDDTFGARSREPAILAGVDADPLRIAVVYSDDRYSDEHIFFTESQDGGTSWGLSTQVSWGSSGGGAARSPDLVQRSGAFFPNPLIVAWEYRTTGGSDVRSALSLDSGGSWDTEVRVNDDHLSGAFDQDWVSLASNGDIAIAVWHDTREGNGDIALSSWNTSGTWGDGLTNDNDVVAAGLGTIAPGGGRQGNSQIVVSGGAVFVMFNDSRDVDEGGITDRNVYFTSSTNAGSTWGDGVQNNNDVRVDDAPPGSDLRDFDFARDRSSGKLYAVYADNRRGGSFDIFITSSSDNGKTWGDGHLNDNDVAVHEDIAAAQIHPVIALAGDGTLFVAWEDYRFVDADVFIARSTDGGLTWIDEVRLNGDMPIGNGRRQTYPALTANQSSAFAAWADDRNGPNFPDVWTRSVRVSGGTLVLGIEREVNDDEPSFVFHEQPAIVMDDSGRLVVAWRDRRSGTWEIRSSYSMDGGSLWGDGVTNNDPNATDGGGIPAVQRGPPSLVADWKVFGAWADDRTTAGNPDAWFSGFNSTTSQWSHPNNRINDAPGSMQFEPDLGLNATTVFAVWGDTRIGGTEHAFFSRAGRMEAPPPPVLRPTLAEVRIDPAGPTNLNASEMQQYRANGVNDDGGANWSWSPDWQLTNWLGTLTPGLGPDRFNATYFAGLVPGVDNITVTDLSTLMTDRSLINILGGPPPLSNPLATIVLTPYPPPTPQLTPTASMVFRATGWNLQGDQNLTWEPAWTAGPGGSVVDLGRDWLLGHPADFTAGTVPGATWLNVYGNGTTVDDSVPINIVPGPVDSLTLNPTGPVDLQPLQTRDFTAVGFDQWGNQNTSWNASWMRFNPLGNVTSTGGDAWAGFNATFEAGTFVGGSGIAVWAIENINAAAGAVVNVVPGPVATIQLTPSVPFTLTPYQMRNYTAKGFDAFGNQNFSWAEQWGTTNGLGWANSTGGSPAAGFTATYTAMALGGVDNITVEVLGSPAVASRSEVWISVPPPPPPEPDPLVRIDLQPWPGPETVVAGATLAFTAKGYGQNGTVNTSWTPEAWIYGDGLLGYVSSFGWNPGAENWWVVFQANTTAGPTSLQVQTGTVYSNTTAINIVPDAPYRIQLDPWPGPISVLPAQTLGGFRAFLLDRYSNLITAWTPVWNASNALGTAVAAGGNGSSGFLGTFFAGNTSGTTGIHVAMQGFPDIARTTAIEIRVGPLDRIAVDPSGNVTLTVGGTRGFRAWGFDEWDNLNLTWAASWSTVVLTGSFAGSFGGHSGNASAGHNTTFTAQGAGTGKVRVQGNGTTIKGDVPVTITLPPPPRRLLWIELAPGPGPVAIAPGSALGFTATGWDGPGLQNTTWNPSWRRTPTQGTLGGYGGDAASGWTALFTAGFALGSVTVEVASATNASLINRTTIAIAGSGVLSRIELTPDSPVTVEIFDAPVFTARAFDAGGNLNTTWRPQWSVTGGIGTGGNLSEPAPGTHQATFLPSGLGQGTARVEDSVTGARNETQVSVVDLTRPASAVDALPPFSTSRSLSLAYTAADAGGASVATVALWYRHNGGSWTPYGAVVPFASMAFTATADGLYEFYSLAVDDASTPNTELPPLSPDASVTIDGTAPTVLSTDPLNGATSVSPATPIVVEFSEAISRPLFESAAVVRVGGEVMSGSWSWAGTQATFVPDAPFPAGATVTLSVPDTAVRDAAGNRMAAELQATFAIAGAGGLPAGLWGFLLLLGAIVGGLLLAFLWARRRKRGQEEGDASDLPSGDEGGSPVHSPSEPTSAAGPAASSEPMSPVPGAAEGGLPLTAAASDARGCTHCAEPMTEPGDRFFCQCGEPYHAKCATELGTCPGCKRVMAPEAPASAIEVIDCPLCEEGNALPQGADPASTWCTACRAPLRELKRGYNHLIISETPEATYRWANGFLLRGVPALVISKTFPDKIKKDYGLETAEIFWLSDTNPAPNVLDPKRVDFEVMRSIGKFVKASKGGVVMVDGIETLVVENGFDKVYKFLRKVTDLCAQHEITLLVPVAPNAFEMEQTTMLTKAFDHAEQFAPAAVPRPKKRRKKAATAPVDGGLSR